MVWNFDEMHLVPENIADIANTVVQMIQHVLKVNSTIRTLHLCNVAMTVNGAQYLADSLIGNSTLKELDIGGEDSTTINTVFVCLIDLL